MQKRYHNFEAEITSYDFARALLAMNRPGRYGGFDTITPQSALTFNVGHNATGVSTTDQLGSAVGPLGHAVTLQGIIVEETAEIGPLTIDTNAGNLSVRYDAIILRHVYTAVVGGSVATYLIKKGPLSNPIFPTVDNPLTDIILGFLQIPAGASTISAGSGIVYTPIPTPDSGGEKDAKINYPNAYKKLQQWNKGSNAGPTFESSIAGEKLLTLKSDGNTFNLFGTSEDFVEGIRFDSENSPQEGGFIHLVLNPGIGITNDKNLSNDAKSKGYRPFYIPRTFQENTLGAIIPPGQGEQKLVELLFLNDKFTVISLINTVGNKNNLIVPAAPDDSKPGTLIDKIRPTDFIGVDVTDDATKGKQVALKVKGAQATWDNVWKILSPMSLSDDHSILSGALPKYKIDFFGVLHLRDFIVIRSTTLASGVQGTTSIGSIPGVSLPRDVNIPIVARHSLGPYGMWAWMRLTASGMLNIDYNYLNIDSAYGATATGIQLNLTGIQVDLSPNPQ